MAIQFDFYKSPINATTISQSYHPRVVNFQHIDADCLAKEIQASSTLTIADIKATIIELSEAMGDHLCQGERIGIEGIGYFQVVLSCNEKPTTQSTHADKVSVRTIKFRPDKYLRKKVNSARIERSQIQIHSNVLTDNQINSILSIHFKTNNFITRLQFQYITGLCRNKAIDTLKQLVVNGKLKNENTKRNPIYEPTDGNYGR